MKLSELVQTSSAVAGTASRLEKIALLAALLQRLQPDEIPIAIGFLTGWPRQGRLGVGWSAISVLRDQPPASDPVLELSEVDRIFQDLVATKGRQSAARRAALLGALFARATAEEQRFLAALALGEVRQGALEGVLLEGVARAAGVASERVRRAAMLAGDLGAVAEGLLGGGGEAVLAKYTLELFRPIQPMLADSAPNVREALGTLGQAALEWKLDGARIQVHRRGKRVAVFTRSLNDVTAAVPEIVAAVSALNASEAILDGEAIALGPDARPLPFQITMRRFGRRLDVETLRAELPLQAFFFDILWRDGEPLLDHPLGERLQHLDAAVPEPLRVPRLVTADVSAAEDFERDALERGHEGVMAKALGAPYAAGRRGSAWLKIKTARTLDLVVLAAEWGSGRRRGWLSNLHLGARDPASGTFVMLGKTFKGMTDDLLQWQTRELLQRETHRERHIVYVRPELVVEVAFNDVQRSPHYPGGVALRFARIKGYRPDKRPSEADTIEAVRASLPR